MPVFLASLHRYLFRGQDGIDLRYASYLPTSRQLPCSYPQVVELWLTTPSWL